MAHAMSAAESASIGWIGLQDQTRADARTALSELKQSGVTPSPGSPAEFGRYLKDEIARYGQLIREKGIKGE